MMRCAALFPSDPDEDVGGVVVGERDRVDLGPLARVPFNPEPEGMATWGNGGKAPLMIDHCKTGVGSMVIGGSGTYKSVSLATTILTWRKSAFYLDPSEELADMTEHELKLRGKKVIRLVIGGEGPNVLDYIDTNDELAETRLRSVVGRIIGPIIDKGDGKDRFKKWGRTIVLALTAHMMWDPEIPRELKTLRALRDGLSVGTERMRDILRGIADTSQSPLARSLAGTMWDMVDETFSGALGNATDDTEWLASSAYGDLVSGTAYNIGDIVNGNTVVFCQIPQEALEHTPAIARVLTGCHLDAVVAAKGQVNGRVFFAIDEAVLLGPDPALKVARDLGRKFKITLLLAWQSLGQIEEVWGIPGKKAWFDSVSWVSYAGFQNIETARDVSAALGKFGARAWSEGVNSGKSGRFMETSSLSSGSNTNEHEISRDLVKAHELLSEMRDDERITFPRKRRAIRHGAAIGFRRPEIKKLLGQSRYRPSVPTKESADA